MNNPRNAATRRGDLRENIARLFHHGCHAVEGVAAFSCVSQSIGEGVLGFEDCGVDFGFAVGSWTRHDAAENAKGGGVATLIASLLDVS